MTELRSTRAVFHSEADFQHAFAWALHRLEPTLNIRLEVRQQDGEKVDLFCFGPQGRTIVELKHFTAEWEGTDPATGEQFHLRGHAATDVGRRGFVFDIARLEKFCAADGAANGFAVMLTNDRALWNPAVGSRLPRDLEFRIHEGRTLSGTLRWGTEGDYYEPNQRELSGSYPLAWQNYSSLGGRNGDFRWLAVAVGVN